MNDGPGERKQDAQLVLASRRGEKKAFVEIVARHQAMVCGVCFAILNDFAASEDAAQEAFLTAWRKLTDLRDPERLRPWIAQIARNAALAHRRRTRPEEPLDAHGELVDKAERPDESIVSRERAELVRDSLERLPESYRLPLVLFYREGKSVRVVAESLGMSEEVVRQRLSRGREMMRERIEAEVEEVLTRTVPTAIFTMTIAAAIGALAAPATIAASAFSAAATAGSTASSSSIVTFMGTTKGLVATGAFVAALCVPAGYQVAKLSEPAVRTQQTVPEQVSPPRTVPRPSFETGALFAEWRALHEKYGTNAAAMPALFGAIEQQKDALRKRAFHAALVSEWVTLDAAGGLSFYMKNTPSGTSLHQFVSEWFKADPNGAVSGLMAVTGPDAKIAEGSLRSLLREMAKRLPNRVPEVAQRLPKTEATWGNEISDAFATMAGGNLEAAKQTAEKLGGPNRDVALAGVSRAWGKVDIDQAITWAKGLAEGVDRDEIIRGALLGLVEKDPAGALDRASIVPPGGRSYYYASTTAARLLTEGARNDFDGTVAWLKNNPDRLNGEDVAGIVSAVTTRLNADPTEFLTRHANDGSLKALAPAINNALMNGAAGLRPTVWDWLKQQPPSDGTKSIRAGILTAAGFQDPELAFRLVPDLTKSAGGEKELTELTRNLLNGGDRLPMFAQLYADAPEAMRPILVKEAFEHLGPSVLDDPSVWVKRIGELPDKEQPKAIRDLARAWGEKFPEEAANWARSLPEDQAHEDAIGTVARSWIKKDERSAGDWINALEPGLDRDLATEQMVYELAGKYPEEARQWTLGIKDDLPRTRSAFAAVQTIARQNPALAQEWIDTVPLSADTKEKLQSIVQNLGKAGTK